MGSSSCTPLLPVCCIHILIEASLRSDYGSLDRKAPSCEFTNHLVRQNCTLLLRRRNLLLLEANPCRKLWCRLIAIHEETFDNFVEEFSILLLCFEMKRIE